MADDPTAPAKGRPDDVPGAERKGRIRGQSRSVADYVAAVPEARQFYEDWGTPAPIGSCKPAP